MKEIELTQNRVAIVDDDDFEYIDSFSWYYDKTTGYPVRDSYEDYINGLLLLEFMVVNIILVIIQIKFLQIM